MQLKGNGLKHNFEKLFIAYLKKSSILENAVYKTYGERIYKGEMLRLSLMSRVADNVKTLTFLKEICPELYIEDDALWKEFIDYAASASSTDQTEILKLLSFFRPKKSIPFILDNMTGGKLAIPLGKAASTSLFKILKSLADEAVPYILRRTPLHDERLVSIIIPYYSRVGSGGLTTLFERVSELFDIPGINLVEPFARGFLHSERIPHRAHPFFMRFFVVPALMEYPEKTDFLLSLVPRLKGIESIDEFLPYLVTPLLNLLYSDDFDRVETGLLFMQQYPLDDAAQCLRYLLDRFPDEKAMVLKSFSGLHKPQVRDVFLNVYEDSSNFEKKIILKYLIRDKSRIGDTFIKERYEKGNHDEQAGILENLKFSSNPDFINLIKAAFESENHELVKAALNSLDYIGSFSSREELNQFILKAVKLNVAVNRGIQNPLCHLLNEKLCRQTSENLEKVNDFKTVNDSLSFAGFLAGKEEQKFFKERLNSPLTGAAAVKAMILSRSPGAVQKITDLYYRSEKEIKNVILDSISLFSDHRFKEIIEHHARLYYKRMDSFTPGDAFLVPIDLKSGFEILSSIPGEGGRVSVQYLLELAAYGGEKALPVLDGISGDDEIRENPRKKLAYHLARFAAGEKEEADALIPAFEDNYLCNYLIYLIHYVAKRSGSYLLPTLEKPAAVDFSPFTEVLFGQFKNYYSWDPMFDRIIEILSVNVNEEEVIRLSEYLIEEYADFKRPVISAFERLKNPALYTILTDVLRLLKQPWSKNVPHLHEIYYRTARLLYRFGVRDEFEKLKKFYRGQIFRFLRNPRRYNHIPIFVPDFSDIFSMEMRKEIFLDTFDSYLSDPDDLRIREEIYLRMIRGIKDDRLIEPIISKLRLCQKDFDLFPALLRLKELTGKTFGVDYHKWKELF